MTNFERTVRVLSGDTSVLPEPDYRYRVRYYDPRRKGVWIAKFVTGAAAGEFAQGRVLYGRPVNVEPICHS